MKKLLAAIEDEGYEHNHKMALKELEKRLAGLKAGKVAAERKARRDHAIKNEETVRTYDFQTGLVHDHRTGKKATIKQVLEKGNLHLVSPTVRESYE